MPTRVPVAAGRVPVAGGTSATFAAARTWLTYRPGRV